MLMFEHKIINYQLKVVDGKILTMTITKEYIICVLNLLLDILDWSNLTEERKSFITNHFIKLPNVKRSWQIYRLLNKQCLENYVLLSELFNKKQVFLVDKIFEIQCIFFYVNWLFLLLSCSKIFVFHIIMIYFHWFINFNYLWLYYCL